jgi:DNA-binding NarL/FixJ family response regulator
LSTITRCYGKDCSRCFPPNRVSRWWARRKTRRTAFPRSAACNRTWSIRIVALTFHREDGYIHAALRAGADGYVLKDDSRDELVLAVRSVLAGKNYLSPAICGTVIEGYLSGVQKKRLEPSWHVLTRRERQVIKMIAEGLKTREIAEELSLSPKTVEKHRTNMMNKLDLHSVSAVTLYAIQSGLIGE